MKQKKNKNVKRGPRGGGEGMKTGRASVFGGRSTEYEEDYFSARVRRRTTLKNFFPVRAESLSALLAAGVFSAVARPKILPDTRFNINKNQERKK